MSKAGGFGGLAMTLEENIAPYTSFIPATFVYHLDIKHIHIYIYIMYHNIYIYIYVCSLL